MKVPSPQKTALRDALHGQGEGSRAGVRRDDDGSYLEASGDDEAWPGSHVTVQDYLDVAAEPSVLGTPAAREQYASAYRANRNNSLMHELRQRLGRAPLPPPE